MNNFHLGNLSFSFRPCNFQKQAFISGQNRATIASINVFERSWIISPLEAEIAKSTVDATY